MKKKILFLAIVITTVGILLFWLVSTEVYHKTLVKYAKENLKIYMKEASEYPKTEDGAVDCSDQLNGARITFISSTGDVIADSKEIDEKTKTYEEVKDAIGCGYGFDVRKTSKISKSEVFYCEKIDDGYIRISIVIDSEIGILGDGFSSILVFLILDLILCFFFAIVATYSLLTPVEELTKKAYFEKEVETEYPELKPLVKMINQRKKEIDRHIKTIEEEKDLVVQAQNSKNEFIANITHEMNTPLTSIKGFAELLNNKELDEEKANKATETILKQSERLTNLIACIINYNEIDGDYLPSYDVDASKIAHELIESFEPTLNGVTLTTDIDEGVIINTRYERINEILNNLISNAIKYNKPEGSVHVILKGGEKPYLKVEDTGLGIAPENIDRIFDRFFTVDRSHNGKNGGFGLGLAVVKKLCYKAEWRLTVKSELGVGTVFQIDFH